LPLRPARLTGRGPGIREDRVPFARRHRRTLRRALAALALLAATGGAMAADDQTPRFVSLRADAVNLRAGPGERYPIEWVYQRKGLPVEVTAEFDVWRKVRDSEGTTGWVHQRMITAQRSVVVIGALRSLRGDPDSGAAVVARAEPGVVARLLECRAAWCRLEAQGVKGWLLRSEIWGVYPDETVQ
jgi:SH3-like domain-containing protein